MLPGRLTGEPVHVPPPKRTQRLLLARAVDAEFDHPVFAHTDGALVDVFKRQVWEFVKPPLLGTVREELLESPSQPPMTQEEREYWAYMYTPVNSIETNYSRRRVEELLGQTSPESQAWLLAQNWANLDYHERRRLLERHVGEELSWSELVAHDRDRRAETTTTTTTAQKPRLSPALP